MQVYNMYAILSVEPRQFNPDEANLKLKELSAAWVLFISGLTYSKLLPRKNAFKVLPLAQALLTLMKSHGLTVYQFIRYK